MQTITRRAAFATPLALAATIPAVAKAQPQETPVLRLFREWQAVSDRLDALGVNTPDEMLDEGLDELNALELKLRATPSVSAADFAAKVVAFSFWGGAMLTAADAPEIWAEARELLGRA